MLSFFMTALSITLYNLPFLFFSRLLAGLCAGGATVTQASVSDIVEEKKRARYMAGFTMVGGLAWIVWPFLGSFFSNSKLVSWFSP